MEERLECGCGAWKEFAVLCNRVKCLRCGKEYRLIAKEGQMRADAALITLDPDAMNTVEHVAG